MNLAIRKLLNFTAGLIDDHDRVLMNNRLLQEGRVRVERVHLASRECSVLTMASDHERRRVLFGVESDRRIERAQTRRRMRRDSDFHSAQFFQTIAKWNVASDPFS